MAFKCFDCAYKFIIYETDGCDQSCDTCDFIVHECENCSFGDDCIYELKETVSCRIFDIKKRPINEHRFHAEIHSCTLPPDMIGDYPF